MKKVLIAGIGGDSHSVGLLLLKYALQKNEFIVNYMGIQNSISEVISESFDVDIALISCMDGQAKTYLRDFVKFKIESGTGCLGYIGGNPTLETGFNNEKWFYDLGFSRVFLKYIEISSIIEFLLLDLANLKLLKLESNPISAKNKHLDYSGISKLRNSNVSDLKLAPDLFYANREQALQQWRTGSAAKNLDENANCMSQTESLYRLEIDNEKRNGLPLLQPRTGVPDPKKQLQLFNKVIAAGADVVSYQVDSLTRNLNYSDSQELIKESIIQNKSLLNGTPLINWGVDVLRKINSTVKRPIQVRHSSKSPELLAEISFASGIQAFEGGSICYNIPYYKDLLLSESIEKWQYVDYLAGQYATKYNLIIHREFFGVLTGTLMPPSLAISTGLIESVLAFNQGVKSVSIGFGESGNLIQDIATVRVINQYCRTFLDNLGARDLRLSATMSQHMGAFPSSLTKSQQLIAGSARAAFVSKPSRLITKTYVESTRIPSPEDNYNSLKMVRSLISEPNLISFDEKKVQFEMEFLTKEVSQIVENVIFRGGGNIASGLIKCFELGELDIPFSPSLQNAGNVIAARDISGAIRFVDTGKLPFSKDIKEFHKFHILERRGVEKIKEGEEYKLVEMDIKNVIEGNYKNWPLDTSY